MGHNTAYKRDVLLAYGAQLDSMLADEIILFQDLARRGCQLYMEPAARVRHLNISRLQPALDAKLVAGRNFGAARARWGRWSLPRRLAFGLLGPWIGLLRLRYFVRNVFRIGRQRDLPRIMPLAAALLFVHGLGEGLGAVFGAGSWAQRWNTYEFERRRHLDQRDINGSRGAT
jgi:hypothetical protein